MKANTTFRFLLPLAIAACTMDAGAQVGINATGAAPAASAMLDLASTTKGLLIPRMTAVSRIAIPAPANGLIVYQTDAPSVTSPKGYWYYDQLVVAWVPVVSGGLPWTIFGNTGTNPATDYVGSSDAQAFVLGTGGVERLRIQPTNGRVGIGTIAVPNELVEINGGLRLNNSSATNSVGAIDWNNASTPMSHEGNVDGTAAGWYPLENAFNERLSQAFQYTTNACTAQPTTSAPTLGANNGTTLGTIEAPYSNFWEDGRHQYLYRAVELGQTGIGLCPNTDITGLAMNTTGGTSMPVRNFEIKMKNTATSSMSNFDLTGLVTVYTSASLTIPGAGWLTHTFSVPFQWNGTANLIVETCHNNYDWDFNTNVTTATTAYSALFGSYCDACGGTGTVPCVPTIPPNPGCALGPCGPGCPGICSGYSMTPGCLHVVGQSMVTCDGTFQWVGAQGSANKHPQIRFAAYYGTVTTSTGTSDYLYSDLPVIIEKTLNWGSMGAFPNNNFKGPGTISAEVSVWAGSTLLTDYVFDKYFDGSVRPEDAHGSGFQHTPLNEMVNYVERERHLPTIDGREQWEKNGPSSVDHLTNQLWVTVEEQALYIKELNERMDILQKYLVEKRLRELKK